MTQMLLLCATPIGNLGDLTPRVREALTASDTRQKLLAENGFALRLPKAVQGYFWGARGELRPAWADLGLRAVAFEKQAEPQILLVSSQA